METKDKDRHACKERPSNNFGILIVSTSKGILTNKGAKKFEHMTHSELLELAYKYDTREAKSRFIFDFFACKVANRAKMRILFVDDSIKDLELAIQGKFHNGTIVE